MAAQNELDEFYHLLTDNARLSLRQAEGIAHKLGSAYIGTEHILLGIMAQSSSIAAKMLAVSGATYDRAKLALNLTPKALTIGAPGSSAKGLSETAKLTLRLSVDVAQEFHQDMCGTEHITYTILTQKNARATVLLQDMNVNVDALISELEDYLGRQQYEHEQSSVQLDKRRTKKKRLLEYFGVNMTILAREGKLDPVVGRQEQISRIVTILGRRTKNNPVLIGEPGVGKTAIVEGLAQRIADEEVPERLLQKQVIMLDLASMIAGTKYRGEFEERLRHIIDEIVEDDRVIVFIDELHLLVGAGAAEGAIDAANIFKPALARGKLQLIGATTLDEYKKHIEKDTAFERRLQPIQVPEPTIEETIEILKGLKKQYEIHHHVQINDEVIKTAAEMASRYISDRFMPDKAIDLIDEAASRVRIERGRSSPEISKLKRELTHLNDLMEEAASDENYERAARYKMRISQIKTRLTEKRARRSQPLNISDDDIAKTVAIMTGVPVKRVIRSEARELLHLEDRLSKSLIGQKTAVSSVARAIRRTRSGITQKNRPIGSFIFLGPTGVGKTELARVLAREFFADETALIKIDMSEFGEKHTASRMIGAPAGYVGYEEGGELTERVRRRPYSLLLFDEIEKAHPDIFNLLLQILEDGYLTDAKGRRVDFRNTIVILTSNIGAEKLQKEAALGFRSRASDADPTVVLGEYREEQALNELKNLMRPELLNRFDKIVVFDSLTMNDVKAILDLQLGDLSKRLADRGITIKVQTSAKEALIAKGYDQANGVRSLRRVIEEELEDVIADGILSDAYQFGSEIKIAHRKEGFVFDAAAALR
ncbi:MAG TPA: ATP-dependent Clp protease ATP-binding subunit [Candidatus Saccharimonadales bacterium]|nr:ATP-dependent Clp protease ATP-binding subunit [Candidatus Saccharimonadales bacterium]